MRGMAAALFGDDIDRDAYVAREGLLGTVMRKIQCDGGGGILDIRSAVEITMTRDGQTIAHLAFTGAKFDELGGVDHVRAVAQQVSATFEIVDGRHYTSAGVLRKAERAKREADRAETQRESAATGQ